MNISEEEKNRIRGLHKSNSTIKEQVTVDPDVGVMLDPDVDIDSQIKQVMDNINGNIIRDLAILIDDLNPGRDDEMVAHNVTDRLAIIIDKIGKGEYLTI